MIRKLLVANRGEIALRVIRTARALGLRTVAVYSEADAAAPHVIMADEAYPIGRAEVGQSYLNIEAILQAGRNSGADAVHPGYGFLSERPDFATAVERAGMKFVGPPATAMAAAGDKIRARQLAAEAEVPIVPGTEVADLAQARRFAERIGFPVLVKAAAGGGGRGMRVVKNAQELEPALEAAAREAMAAFGDGRVYLERCLEHPRHVEVQILADSFGSVLTLGERECSIQRRHQKIVEESPAPGLSPSVRKAMLAAASRLALRAGYVNAGTFEFLVDGDDFYFLEINARLQVEHPVTELCYGIDLVAEQLRIASGEPVSSIGEPRGAAIEVRICAEDPAQDFQPGTGRVAYLNQPSGPGIRVDSALMPGLEITAHYDNLLAKVIAWGIDREQARSRLARALDEFVLAGVTHNAGFLRALVETEAFRAARLHTGFLDQHGAACQMPAELRTLALALAPVAERIQPQAGIESVVRTWDGARTESQQLPWVKFAGFTPWRGL